MNFISGLPKSKGNDVIFVMVDMLNKYAHFMPLSHPFITIQVAQCYLNNVFKLHSWPQTIVSYRDFVFLNTFCKGLFSLHDTDFLLSSAYHPQTDGKIEVVNRYLETYLRCMCNENLKNLSSWLPLEEWWYNFHFHTSVQITLNELV